MGGPPRKPLHNSQTQEILYLIISVDLWHNTQRIRNWRLVSDGFDYGPSRIMAKDFKIVPTALLQCHFRKINSMSRRNTTAQNRSNSLPCTVKTSRRRPCNLRVGCLQLLRSIKRIFKRIILTIDLQCGRTANKQTFLLEYPTPTPPTQFHLAAELLSLWMVSTCVGNRTFATANLELVGVITLSVFFYVFLHLFSPISSFSGWL